MHLPQLAVKVVLCDVDRFERARLVVEVDCLCRHSDV
jgi:hypothetical protein